MQPKRFTVKFEPNHSVTALYRPDEVDHVALALNSADGVRWDGVATLVHPDGRHHRWLVRLTNEALHTLRMGGEFHLWGRASHHSPQPFLLGTVGQYHPDLWFTRESIDELVGATTYDEYPF
jgi:hypothetical protein